MFWKFLHAQLEGLSPESRFLLVRFTQVFGAAPSQPMTEVALRKVIGLSRHLFSQGRAVLEQREYLQRRSAPIPTGGNTERHHVYSLGEKGIETIKSPDRSESPWRVVAANLLSDGGQADASILRPPNRLLLAVLYAWADDFGVVRDLGLPELGRLTGLNENRLKIQINKLRGQEYIRAIVPGISGGQLFGRVKSVYFLNMGLPSLGRHRLKAVIFVNTTRPLKSGEVDRDAVSAQLASSYAERMLRAVSSGMVGAIKSGSDLRGKPIEAVDVIGEIDVGLARFFMGLFRQEVRNYQQYKLEEYASYILTNHWGAVKRGTDLFDSPLWQMIAAQFFGSNAFGGVANWMFWMNIPDGPVGVVLRVAVQMARDVQSGMARFPDVPFGEMKHCILPRDLGNASRRSIVVVSISKENGASNSACHILTELDGELSKAVFKDESLIPLADRHYYGLLTDPEAGPRRYRVPNAMALVEHDDAKRGPGSTPSP